MEILFTLLVLGFAAAGIRSLTNATTTRVRAVMDAWRTAVEQEKARRAAGQPGRTASWLSGLFFALGMWAAAGRAGLRIGWEYGRIRPVVNPEPEQQTRPSAPPSPQPPQQRAAEQPPTTPVDEQQKTTTTQPSEESMASEPVVIENLETAIREYEQLRADAQTEFEEAQAAVTRAQQDLARVTADAETIAALDFPDTLKAKALSLIESNRADEEAARKKLEAAEQRLAETTAVLDELYRHRGIQDAAAAAGGMARKEAYVNA
jgi:hypothetical protein